MKKEELNNQETFTKRLKDPARWLSKADELIFVANILKDKLDSHWKKVADEKNKIIFDYSMATVQGVYLMLIAFAFENFCKAIIVGRNRKEWERKTLKTIPDVLKNHKLRELVEKNIGMKLDISEQCLLERLSRYATWDARYPTPTAAVSIGTRKNFSDGHKYHVAYVASFDSEEIMNFISRLQVLIKKEISA
ncbi:MAG: hypothetical protein V1863_07040 [Candidatus Omnitrophota bacterium]